MASVVLLSLFAELSGLCLETLGECIHRLRALFASGGAAASDRAPQFFLTEIPLQSLLDAGDSVVGTTDHV